MFQMNNITDIKRTVLTITMTYITIILFNINSFFID